MPRPGAPAPWDYWWVFPAFTPHAAAAGMRTGRFGRRAVGLFWAAVTGLGIMLQPASWYLLGHAG